MVAFDAVAVRVVVMVNVSSFVPSATTTPCGTIASGESEVTPMTAPPGGAGAPSVTVAFALAPPSTAGGAIVNAVSIDVEGAMVSVALIEFVRVAVMTAFVCAATAVVVIANCMVVAPAGMTTVDRKSVGEGKTLEPGGGPWR